MSDTTINYAAIFGIGSVAAAVIFTILFAPLAGYYIWRAVTRFNFVFVSLHAFCLIRVVGFAVRAAIAGSSSAATNLGLAIAEQILFGMGFSGLLLATFSVQGDRERMAGIRYENPILLFLTNRRVFYLVMVAAIALFITGVNILTNPSSSDKDLGNTLRKSGTLILLGLTAITSFRAGLFIHSEQTKAVSTVHKVHSFSDKYAGMLLSLISGLLLERMIYSVITTMTNSSQPEKIWYPLNALPEFLCACLIATPGLVVSRKELKEKEFAMEEYHKLTPCPSNFCLDWFTITPDVQNYSFLCILGYISQRNKLESTVVPTVVLRLHYLLYVVVYPKYLL